MLHPNGLPIAVDHLTKRFGEVLAVDDLSFEVETGKVCGLLGPNGAGKTTTLRALVGLVRPTGGETRLMGTTVRPGHPVLARVGVLVDQPAFLPFYSGEANLRAFWKAGGGTWPPPGLDSALDLAGLGKALGRKVKGYSQGMRQRLGIAQALLGNPGVLVLDEPTSGLDPQEMREVRKLVSAAASGGTTVLLSSHLLSEVEQVCSDAVVMDHGRLVAAGTVHDLIGADDDVYVEVDDRDAARDLLRGMHGIDELNEEPPGFTVTLDGLTRPQLVAALVGAGIGVETVTSRRRLEDAVLRLLAEEEATR